MHYFIRFSSTVLVNSNSLPSFGSLKLSDYSMNILGERDAGGIFDMPRTLKAEVYFNI